jgi:chromatin remodeling complex protein RSC6
MLGLREKVIERFEFVRQSHCQDSGCEMDAGKFDPMSNISAPGFTTTENLCIAFPGQRRHINRMAETPEKTKRTPSAAFMKPVQPDEKLAKIVGDKPLPRTELTKQLWAYIREHGLQDATKKTLINADENLKAVFDGKEQVSMFEMTKLVSGHVKK